MYALGPLILSPSDQYKVSISKIPFSRIGLKTLHPCKLSLSNSEAFNPSKLEKQNSFSNKLVFLVKGLKNKKTIRPLQITQDFLKHEELDQIHSQFINKKLKN